MFNRQLKATRLKAMRDVDRGVLMSKIQTSNLVVAKGNTNFEEITCLGYDPESSQLQAVVRIKKNSGYGGNLCSNGSLEHVRFFIDWSGGTSNFEEVGLSSFKAYNISDFPLGKQHPLDYLVYIELDDEQRRKSCNSPVLPNVRAILSWNTLPPTDADKAPYYGNVVDARIQIKPRAFRISDVLIDLPLQIKENFDLTAMVPLAPAKAMLLDAKAIQTLRKNKVPDTRILFPVVSPILANSQVVNPYAPIVKAKELAELKIDISKILAAFAEKDKANVDFEELLCVGLNSETDTLGAVVHVKKNSGYSGSLCQNGSLEHVAFWADWNNNGGYEEYLGTSSFQVHDIQQIPDGGLFYNVQMKISHKVLKRLKACNKTNVVGIRAVLSWHTPPSKTDSNDLGFYGNRKDALVQIRPGTATTKLFHRVDFIGNIEAAVNPVTGDLLNIDNVTHLAYPSTTHALGNNRPWGGLVSLRAEILNSGAPYSKHFQVQFKRKGQADSAWAAVNTAHTFRRLAPGPLGTVGTNVPVNSADYGGWFPYIADPANGIAIKNDVLAYWNTNALANGAYDLRLAYTADHGHAPANIQYSQVYTIMIDNVRFTVNPGYGAAVDPAYTVDLVIDGGDCHQYEKGESFTGHLRIVDKYFGRWTLNLQPAAHFPAAPYPVTPRTDEVENLGDNGPENGSWTLDTGTLNPCGYTVRLVGWKRTIFNSAPHTYHWAHKYVGFSVV